MGRRVETGRPQNGKDISIFKNNLSVSHLSQFFCIASNYPSIHPLLHDCSTPPSTNCSSCGGAINQNIGNDVDCGVASQ